LFIVRRKDVENQLKRVICPLRRKSAIYFLEEYSGKSTHGERKYYSYAADIYFPKSEPAMNLLPVTGLSPPPGGHWSDLDICDQSSGRRVGYKP
jgi:hypothetical protein